MRPQFLHLRAPIPLGVGDLLPNLQRLQLWNCKCADGFSSNLAAFSNLQSLVIEGSGVTAGHLEFLTALPRLSSIYMGGRVKCSAVLPSLSSQLTALELDKNLRRCLGGTQQPAPAWRATLQHVAQCTQLRSLTIPCVTGEELALVAPALAQLRDLHLCGWWLGRGSLGGDTMVEALLGLPHLTSLHWEQASCCTIQRSYADRPCRWKQLVFRKSTPQLLARLPLHCLTSPLAWEELVINSSTSVADAQAAATAAARCPAGMAWRLRGRHDDYACVRFVGPPGLGQDRVEEPFEHGATEADTPAALLRAMRPLVAALTLDAGGKAVTLIVDTLAWDVEAVREVGAALPTTCTKLVISNGRLPLPALVEVAYSLPQLERLAVGHTRLEPSAVMAYISVVGALRRMRWEGSGGPRLKRIEVDTPRSWEEEDEVGGSGWNRERMKRQAQELVEGLELRLMGVHA